MSIYKFIFIPIIFLFFIAYHKAKKNYKKNYLSIINICVFIFFSYVVYIHQILTMNQEFIYFLIPIQRFRTQAWIVRSIHFLQVVEPW